MARGSSAPWGHNPYIPWGENVTMSMGMPWLNYMHGGGQFVGFQGYTGGPPQPQVSPSGAILVVNIPFYGGAPGGPSSSSVPLHGLPVQHKSPFLATLNLPDLPA